MSSSVVPVRTCHGGLAATGCGRSATKVVFESLPTRDAPHQLATFACDDHVAGAAAWVHIEEFFKWLDTSEGASLTVCRAAVDAERRRR